MQFNAMGLGIANAAKYKLVGMLAKKLESDKVYVGQITIMGMVKGTAFDQGNATIDPRDVAAKFWSLYEKRTENKVDFG